MSDSIFLIYKVAFYSLIIAFVFCVLGLILHFGDTESPLLSIKRVAEESFFTFTNARHWCLYATLAIALGTLCISQANQHFQLKNFLRSQRFFFLMMQLVLFISIYLMGFSAYTILASIVFLVSILLNAGDALPSKRLAMVKFKDEKKPSYSKIIFPISLYGLIILGLLAAIYFSLMEIINTKDIMAMINLESRERIMQDLAPLMDSREYFGWGACSFSEIFSFVQSSDMGNSQWTYPHTDLVAGLLEYGIVGVALFVFTPLLFVLRAIATLKFNSKSLALIVCIVPISLLMIISNPMQNPFLQSFYMVSLFALMAWQKAETKKFI